MKKSKVISTLAISMFAFTMINCSSAKHDTKLHRDKLNPTSKSNIDCKINTQNPVGEFYQQVKNMNEVQKSTMGSQTTKNIVVEVVKGFTISDSENIILNNQEFRNERERAQFIKNFLPNGLVKTYNLGDEIESLPNKNCVGRSLYAGDPIIVNGKIMRVTDSKKGSLEATGSKVIETAAVEYNGSLKAVNNSVESAVGIEFGTTHLEKIDKRNKSLQVFESSEVISKKGKAEIYITKEYIIIPETELSVVEVDLEGNSLGLLASLYNDSKKAELKKIEQKTLVDDFKAVGNWIVGKAKEVSEDITFKITNEVGIIDSKISLKNLISADQLIDQEATKKIESVESINVKNNKPPETPTVDEKTEEDTLEEKSEASKSDDKTKQETPKEAAKVNKL